MTNTSTEFAYSNYLVIFPRSEITTRAYTHHFNGVKAIKKVAKARVIPEVFDVNREWKNLVKYDMMISKEKGG